MAPAQPSRPTCELANTSWIRHHTYDAVPAISFRPRCASIDSAISNCARDDQAFCPLGSVLLAEQATIVAVLG